MSIEIKIPEVGESISEVQISEWLKSEGDTVTKDEPLAVIDSEKTTFELPATEAGTLTKILHQAGETVAVGAAIAQLEPDGAPAAKPQAGGAPPRRASKPRAAAETPATDAAKPSRPPPEQKSEPAPSPPVAKSEEPKPAAEIDSAPTGPREAAAEGTADAPKSKAPPQVALPPPEPPPQAAQPSSVREEEVVPMTMLRRTIARRLVEVQQSLAMLTTFNEVDLGAVQQLRHEHQEAFHKRHGIKLGLMSFFVKAAIDALKQFPQLNAEVRGNDIVYRNYFDLGVAIATERGLVVPVLRRAERLSFAEIEKAIADFAARAKDVALKPEDLEGGTFTITNGGVFGSLLSTPIINPPQSGILGLHAIEDRPVARAGQVVIRPMMYLALTYDHRIVDGREAVLFLRRLREAVETPARMLIEV